jgi:hypothetical protein
VHLLSTIKHIATLLDSLELKYTVEEKGITMYWKTDHHDQLTVRVVTSHDESWVYIVAPLMNFYEIAESRRMKLAYDMLKESWKANGVKYAINEDDDIIVVAETNDTDLKVEEIQTLIGHVVLAADNMYEIRSAAR